MRPSDPTKESGTREAVERLGYYLRNGGHVSWDDVNEVLVEREELEAERDALREAVDVQLGRHLCYTSEDSRRRFWRVVDAALDRRP